MSAKGYTTEAKINAFLGISAAAGAYNNIILAVEKIIDIYTGRNFKADSTASARFFDGDGSQELVIDDCVEVTKVEIGSNCYGDSFTDIPNTGSNKYYTLPNNNAALGVPIRKLLSRAMYFIEGIQNHRITAKWGYSAAVPDDIAYAATVLAAGMYNYGKSGQVGGIKSEKIGDYNVSFGDENGWDEYQRIMNILDTYKKFEL